MMIPVYQSRMGVSMGAFFEVVRRQANFRTVREGEGEGAVQYFGDFDEVGGGECIPMQFIADKPGGNTPLLRQVSGC